MLFNSYIFIFAFLPISFVVYFVLNKYRLLLGAKVWLIGASWFFYGYWNVIYLPLLIGSIVFNFTLSKQLIKTPTKALLLLGIGSNIAFLGYFKYTDFFIENINFTRALFGAGGQPYDLLGLALPLAISFFTLQQIAYLVDNYKGLVKEQSFLDYCVFVSFFPQLIAGPIVHHKEMMPQFASLKSKVLNYKNIALGLFVFSIGLFKKVVLADTFATWATNGFDKAEVLNFIEAWLTSLSYTFQLYFDFSGYADMAIGCALFFNIRLPDNFNSPYKALNIQDFWRRWHITLSRFMRDYLYIPLGGNRLGEFTTCLNLFAVFVIGGIWHGAGWTFIVWGALHGAALVIYRLWQKLGIQLYALIAWVITFNFINLAWIFFRAKELEDAFKVIKGMVGMSGVRLPRILESKLGFLSEWGVVFGYFILNVRGEFDTFIWIFIGFILFWFRNSGEMRERFGANKRDTFMVIFALCYSYVYMGQVSTFIYFNF